MNKNSFLALALSILAIGPVQAQDVNLAQKDVSSWMLRLRATYLNWSNTQTDGVQKNNITAKNRVIPELDLSYFFTKNIAAELVLTYPQSVDIKVAGIKAGTVQALPPTLLLQYHLTDLGKLKPYVGAGINYTIFSDRNNILNGAASVSQASVGYALQVGADYMFTRNWGLNLDLKYIRMREGVSLNTPTGNTIPIGHLGLNPLALSAGVTYRF